MGKKSRYINYAKGISEITTKHKQSTKKSLLLKLNQLKGQEFKVNIPLGGMDGD